MTRADNGAHAAAPSRRTRTITSISDQVLFSFSNFALTIVVAHSVSTNDFGAFAVVVATNLICAVVLRGLTSETLVVRFSSVERPVWRHAASSAGGAALAVSVVTAAGVAVCGILIGGVTGTALVTLATMLPGLALQDYLRFAAFALGRPMYAVVNDLTQVTSQFAITAALLASHHRSMSGLILAWGAASYLGAAVGCFVLKVIPQPQLCLSWFRNNGSLAWRYAVDDFANQGSIQVSSYIVAARADLADAGAFRGALTVFGPSSIVSLGIQSAAVPELVRSVRSSESRFHREVIVIGSALGLVSMGWGAIAVLLPTHFGRLLFGGVWAQAHPLLIYIAIGQAANGFRLGPAVGMRALGAAKSTLRARWVGTSLGFATEIAGAFVHGALGVAIADAIVRPIEAVIWWRQYDLARKSNSTTLTRQIPVPNDQ